MPGGLYISGESFIYKVYEPTGQTITKFGLQYLLSPGKIYSEPESQSLLVTDHGKNEIKILDPGRKGFQKKSKPWTVVKISREIEHPQSLALDGQGNMWIAERKEGSAVLYRCTKH